MIHPDDPASESARKTIGKAERRVAELQDVLDHLAGRGPSTEFAEGLVKTFEEDLAVSRAKLARLKP